MKRPQTLVYVYEKAWHQCWNKLNQLISKLSSICLKKVSPGSNWKFPQNPPESVLKPDSSTSPSEFPRRGLRSDCSLHQKGWIRSSSNPHPKDTKHRNKTHLEPRKPSSANPLFLLEIPGTIIPNKILCVYGLIGARIHRELILPHPKESGIFALPNLLHILVASQQPGHSWLCSSAVSSFLLLEDCLISALKPPLHEIPWDLPRTWR